MKIGSREFDASGHTYIMGILNVTPDSFSDGGRWNEMDNALRHVEQMLKDGMDILDIGGESTRPGYTMLTDEEESARVVPVIEAVKSRFDVPVSLDTYKSAVAKHGIAAGADMINDIWGFKWDGNMARVVAEADVSCCLMHNRHDRNYENFVADVLKNLGESIKLAKDAGVADNRICVDPGVGFAKSYENNLEIVRRVGELGTLGYPILLGTSRKSFIGKALGIENASERMEGTVATTVIGVMAGCAFVRVHDVKENKRAALMTEIIMRG